MINLYGTTKVHFRGTVVFNNSSQEMDQHPRSSNELENKKMFDLCMWNLSSRFVLSKQFRGRTEFGLKERFHIVVNHANPSYLGIAKYVRACLGHPFQTILAIPIWNGQNQWKK